MYVVMIGVNPYPILCAPYRGKNCTTIRNDCPRRETIRNMCPLQGQKLHNHS